MPYAIRNTQYAIRNLGFLGIDLLYVVWLSKHYMVMFSGKCFRNINLHVVMFIKIEGVDCTSVDTQA